MIRDEREERGESPTFTNGRFFGTPMEAGKDGRESLAVRVGRKVQTLKWL